MRTQVAVEPELAVNWFENSYNCPECGTSWTDAWSCTCNDRCPTCNLEIEPTDSVDLSRPVSEEDFIGAAEMIFGSRASVGNVTPLEAQCYGESLPEGGEYRFKEWLEERDLAASI